MALLSLRKASLSSSGMSRSLYSYTPEKGMRRAPGSLASTHSLIFSSLQNKGKKSTKINNKRDQEGKKSTTSKINNKREKINIKKSTTSKINNIKKQQYQKIIIKKSTTSKINNKREKINNFATSLNIASPNNEGDTFFIRI